MSINMVHESNAIVVLPRILTKLTPFISGLIEIQTEIELPGRDVVLCTKWENRYKPDFVAFLEKLTAYIDAFTKNLNED